MSGSAKLASQRAASLTRALRPAWGGRTRRARTSRSPQGQTCCPGDRSFPSRPGRVGGRKYGGAAEPTTALARRRYLRFESRRCFSIRISSPPHAAPIRGAGGSHEPHHRRARRDARMVRGSAAAAVRRRWGSGWERGRDESTPRRLLTSRSLVASPTMSSHVPHCRLALALTGASVALALLLAVASAVAALAAVSHIPGPRWVPLVGHVPWLVGGTPWRVFAEWARR
jgi:hypothetical protein